MKLNRTIIIVVLTCESTATICSAVGPGSEPNAVELVRAVRESENWLHRIDNLHLRVEGQWSRSEVSIAIRRAELKKQNPDEEPDPQRHIELQPKTHDSFEYTIDFKGKRLRCVENASDGTYFLRIWDGKQYTRYYKFRDGHQEYDMESTTKSFETLFGSMSWPRAQPQSFWWDPVDVEQRMQWYGHEEDFKMTGRADYRGVPCYVLEYIRTDDPPLNHHWYVGVKDHLLYGRLTESKMGSVFEYWTLDYREISPECWIPMTQGYSLPKYDSEKERFFVGTQRDVRITDVKINEKLPDELFQMEFIEGLYVADRRSGKTVVYIYRPTYPSLIGQSLPEMDGLGIKLESDRTTDKRMLICFWDVDQRPSRRSVIQLAKQAEALKERGVIVLLVQASKKEENAVWKWTEKNGIPLPVGIIQGDEKKVRLKWGVKSLPWLILTDREHIIQAEGFGLDELDGKTKQAGDGK
jgi:hypothetical protein